MVPFYDGPLLNVIPVYENSHFFQGYISQGLKHFYKEDYTHYFFIGDDLILNPIITENNYQDLFKLDEDTSFIQELDSMPAARWVHNRKAIAFTLLKKGVEVKKELPGYEEANEIIKRLNVKNGAYSYKDVYLSGNRKSIRSRIFAYLNYLSDRYI